MHSWARSEIPSRTHTAGQCSFSSRVMVTRKRFGPGPTDGAGRKPRRDARKPRAREVHAPPGFDRLTRLRRTIASSRGRRDHELPMRCVAGDTPDRLTSRATGQSSVETMYQYRRSHCRTSSSNDRARQEFEVLHARPATRPRSSTFPTAAGQVRSRARCAAQNPPERTQ